MSWYWALPQAVVLVAVVQGDLEEVASTRVAVAPSGIRMVASLVNSLAVTEVMSSVVSVVLVLALHVFL